MHAPPQRPVRTRVAIADDNLIVREGLAQMLSLDDQIALVATCRDLDELERAVERSGPDVILTDIRMPPTMTDEGIRVAARLRAAGSPVGVIILSQYADIGFVLALLGGGSDGRGYLLKESVRDRAQLRAAITTVAAGGSIVDPKLLAGLMRTQDAVAHSRLGELTPREREILGQIAQCKSNAAIADALMLNRHSVEKHINSIFQKLALGDAEDVSKRVSAALLFLADAAQQVSR
jgi:DNA-binding NarL/FixJ family response regulator